MAGRGLATPEGFFLGEVVVGGCPSSWEARRGPCSHLMVMGQVREDPCERERAKGGVRPV